MSVLQLTDLGRAAYGTTLALQKRLVEQTKTADEDLGHLLLVEHDPPVITLGRRGKDDDLLVSRRRLAEMGLEVHESSRGGEVTYHGPGQLVGYPIIQLARRGGDVRSYVRNLEETLIRLLGRYGLQPGRKEKFTGVWVGNEKVAAIGVAVHRWVTYHGFALNVCTDLSRFELIVPCGIRDKRITSMSELLGRDVTVEEVKPKLVEIFCEVFEFDSIEEHPADT
ncbi:MAG TPA: lipoyl(octanoyl) transferase LipB [Phycisphaerae bacterium]|nr:lipoyl(octanoyl) transferase LipB [Phycisphaerae bacterium]